MSSMLPSLTLATLLASGALGTTPPSPAIALAGAAYDAARARLVIVGAEAADSLAQTWEWDGTGWIRATAPGPSAREEPLLAYDERRQRVVLHGGYHGAVAFNDTWEWDGSHWERVATDGPPPRSGSAAAWDARRGRVMLFGGASHGPGAEHNDLWAWDGTRWTQLVADSQPGSPPARGLHGLAYDRARDRLVVYGGFAMENGRPHPIADTGTWEWDGRAWRRVDAAGPGPRDHVAMVYDARRRAIVMHGGANPPVTGLLGETWLYDGMSWRRLLDDGPPRGRHRLAYDARANAVLLYGGWGPRAQSTDLWALGASTWRRVSPD